MKSKEAPEKIYIPRLISDGKLIHEWNDVPFKKFRFFFDKEIAENVEYTRTDAFIEKVINFLNYKLDDVVAIRVPDTIIPHCAAKQELIEDFRKYMKGE